VIVGPNIQYADMKFWEETINNKANYNQKIFELKKDKVYKQDINSKCFMVYTTMVNRERIDQDL